MKRLIVFFMAISFVFSDVSVLAGQNSIDDISQELQIPDTEEDNSLNEPAADENEDIQTPDNTESDVNDEKKEYELTFNDAELAAFGVNVENTPATTEEKIDIYNVDNFIRRAGVPGEAYIVYEIPYVSEFLAISCHRPTDVAEFTFEISKDAEEWESVEAEIDIITDESIWTRLEYTVENIENARYVKVIWGEEKESANWWNPYFVGIFANVGERVAKEVVINNSDEVHIPVYDSLSVELSAEILDQIGLEVEGEIVWSLKETTDERIVIDENNSIKIFSDMTEGTSFTVKAETSDSSLLTEKTITLKPPVYGDVDGDNEISYNDISLILTNYGKVSDADNRLCDIDKNGLIDIVDLAYAARYMKVNK